MTLFKDIAKCATSLVDDDFDSKMTIKAKSKAAYDVGLTSKSVISSSGAVTGSLEAKYSFKNTAFAIDKLGLDSTGKLTCETSLTPDMVNGLTIGLNRTQGKQNVNELNFDLKQKQFHADSKITKIEGQDGCSIDSSILAKINHCSFGGKLGSSMDLKNNTNNLCESWGLGASYCNGKVGLWATTENLSSHSLWASYKCSDQFKCATELTCVPDSKKWSTALVGAYACNKSNTFKAKVTKSNNALTFNLGHKSAIQKGTEVSGGIAYTIGDDKPTYGFTVTLTPK